jgi:hypothetical protein
MMLSLLISTLVCFSPSSGAASRVEPPPPAVLYGDLLLSVFPNDLVPRGYVVTVVQKYPISPPSRRHHAVGAVVVNFNHGRAGIIYVIFPTKADVRARWRDGLAEQGREITVDRQAVRGREIDGWTSLDGRRVGVTDVVFPDGLVLVSTVTTSVVHRAFGDRDGALRLARAGLSQLRRLER